MQQQQTTQVTHGQSRPSSSRDRVCRMQPSTPHMIRGESARASWGRLTVDLAAAAAEAERAHVVERHARAHDQHPLVAERGERGADAEVERGIQRADEGQLRRGDVRLGQSHLRRDKRGVKAAKRG